eukprot:gene17039-23331_t
MPPELDVYGRGPIPDNILTQPCTKLKLDSFFLQWLSENQSLVGGLLEDVKIGRPLKGPQPAASGPGPACPVSPSAAGHSIFSSTMRSPRSPMSPIRKSVTLSTTSLKRGGTKIDQFYFPRPATNDVDSQKAEFATQISSFFKEQGGKAARQKDFVDMLKKVCEIPTMVGFMLFRRLAGSDDAMVSSDTFLKFWTQRKLFSAPLTQRLFDCFRKDGQDVRRSTTWPKSRGRGFKFH